MTVSIIHEEELNDWGGTILVLVKNYYLRLRIVDRKFFDSDENNSPIFLVELRLFSHINCETPVSVSAFDYDSSQVSKHINRIVSYIEALSTISDVKIEQQIIDDVKKWYEEFDNLLSCKDIIK